MTPNWCHAAAAEIYDRIEQITADSMQTAQVEQDSEAGQFEFTNVVAGIIETHFRGFKGLQCTCHQPTRFGFCPVHEADR